MEEKAKKIQVRPFKADFEDPRYVEGRSQERMPLDTNLGLPVRNQRRGLMVQMKESKAIVWTACVCNQQIKDFLSICFSLYYSTVFFPVQTL